MTLFKGYAEARGFRPVKIPDLSAKVRQQGLTKMRGMEQALAANRRQDAQIVRQLEREAQIEKDNNERNFQLKQGYGEVLAKAEWKRFEQGIKNERVKQKNREQDLKAILSLVPTGLKLVQAWDAKRKADIDVQAKDLYDKYGVGSKRFNLIRSWSDEALKEATNKEGFIISPNGERMSPQLVNRIRSMGAYGTLKVHELTAQRIARSSLGYYLDNSNTKYTVAGQEVSFNDANEDVEDLILTKILNQRREELGEDFPSTNIWHGSGAHTIDENARAQMRKIKNQKRERQAKEEQHDETLSTIKHLIGRNNGQGVWSGPIGIQHSIFKYAGGEDAPREALSKARKKVVAAVVHGLQNNQLDWEDVKGLETLEITPRGSEKPKLWGDHFEKEWFQIEKAGLARDTIDNQLANRGPKRRDTADLTMQNKMIELDASEDPELNVTAESLLAVIV